jgi:hypothetical protein
MTVAIAVAAQTGAVLLCFIEGYVLIEMFLSGF